MDSTTRTPMYPGRRRNPQNQEPRVGSERPPRPTPWVEIYAAVHTLQAQGLPVATIARQLGISRPTVYAYVRRTTPPGPKQPQFQWTTRFAVSFSRVCAMAHLPLFVGSLAIEKNGPQIKPFAYIRISDHFDLLQTAVN
jgi:Homeodomain-like domain